MTCTLTLQEKLRDLRDERKLTIAELSEMTMIPTSTLQRLESEEDYRTGYQDIRELAAFYKVSTDFLFGLSDNRIPYNIKVNELCLSDSAVETLREQKINTRLLSALIAHPDFFKLLTAVEIYLDRTIDTQVKSWNAVFELAEHKIREQYKVGGNDMAIQILKEGAINEDEFLLNKVIERFRSLIVTMYDEHKKNVRTDEQSDVIKALTGDIDELMKSKSKGRAKLALLGKQIGLNTKVLTDEETEVLIKALEKSDMYRNNRGRKK
ncbi:MAG: helix-turn-helix domain-containing protein [Oscillospiraceae bacterium]|nr:helix-turn-helix domain-containing protein [Oscillospiraceae bacterium]